MDEPFDLLTCEAAGRRERRGNACPRCGCPGVLDNERFDSDLALFKYSYECPDCKIGWVHAE